MHPNHPTGGPALQQPVSDGWSGERIIVSRETPALAADVQRGDSPALAPLRMFRIA